VVPSVRIDGISTINERKLHMTKETPLATKPQMVTLDAATLRNLALQSETSSLTPHEEAALSIVELLARLSPTNMQLAEDIVRCIHDAQLDETA
jgi:hypothetical protein